MSRSRSAGFAAVLPSRRDDWRAAFVLLAFVLLLLATLAIPLTARAADAAVEEQAGTTAPAAPVVPEEAEIPLDANVVGWLELSGSLRDGPIPFAWVSKAEAEPSLSDVLSQLNTVATGKQYMCVCQDFSDPEAPADGLLEKLAVKFNTVEQADAFKKSFEAAQTFNADAKAGKDLVWAETVEDIEEVAEDDIDTNKTADAEGQDD